jgi:hypothetical protein
LSIDIDIAKAARRPADLVHLARAVQDAAGGDEANWIEWKGSLDLDSVDGRFTVARAILGFANRPNPDLAARFTEGCAYLLVGVEPGVVAGVTEIDVAKLDDGLRPYLGDPGPAWSPMYVSLEGKIVLVVTVEPPRWGDPFYPLRKPYQPPQKKSLVTKGTVFVRGQAKTERASEVDLDLLQERLRRSVHQSPLDLNVVTADAGSVELATVDLSPEAEQEWLDERRVRLMAPVQAAQSPHSLYKVNLFPSLAAAATSFASMTAETRTPEQYQHEVDEYLDACRDQLAAVSINWLLKKGRNSVRLSVSNPTDRHYNDVEITVHVPGEVVAFGEHERFDWDASLPHPPWPYGKPRPLGEFRQLPHLRPFTSTPRVRRLHIENGGSTTLRFPIGDVRPRRSIPLEVFNLVVGEPPDATLEATWTATSPDVHGVQEGQLRFTVADDALTPLDLIPAKGYDAEVDE